MSLASDPSQLSVENGRSLIEASAGTGKTYTLSHLVLRLILERGVPIERIVVVTFTEAATAELKDRIRSLLAERLKSTEADESESLQRNRLLAALDAFDEAPISTIHGFCKRSLDQAALETGSPFDAELKNVDQELVEALRNEYIRSEAAEHSPLVAACVKQSSYFIAALDRLGSELRHHPFAKIEPEAPPKDPRGGLLNSFQAIAASYTQASDEIAALASEGMIARRKSTTALRELKPQLTAWQQGQMPTPLEIEFLHQLRPELVAKAVKKNYKHMAHHQLFQEIDKFLEHAAACILHLIHGYKPYLYRRLGEEKSRLNMLSFNDLLQGLAKALRSDATGSIHQAIACQYDAVLVDEFQDTDPTQYEIISRLFDGGEHALFLVGDPKQAIYKFRGADIFTYLKATQEIGNQASLANNYRSSPLLLEGFNAFFGHKEDFFVFDSIRYTLVAAGLSQSESKQLHSVDGKTVEPLNLMLPEPPEPSLNMETWRERLARWTAREIQMLLGDIHQLGDAPVAANDITILVNTHRQADTMQAQLDKAGIDSVIVAERSIFETEEAEHLSLLLQAIEAPSKISFAKAALLSPLFGYDWTDLIDGADKQDEVEASLLLLCECKREWSAITVTQVIERLFERSNRRAAIARLPHGDRRIANYLQLSDALQEEQRKRPLSPRSLALFLEETKQADIRSEEAWQQRLPSDAQRVQIYTLYKSKGLQFPIVFCPFISLQTTSKRKQGVLYHQNTDSASLTLDLAFEASAESQEQASLEERAEFARLLYVGLTRAESACWLPMAPIGPASYDNSRMSLFLETLMPEDAMIVDEASAFEHLSQLAEFLKGTAPQSVNVSTLPKDDALDLKPMQKQQGESGDVALRSRNFDRAGPIVSRGVLSFSSLSNSTHDSSELAELPDRDRIVEELEASDDASPSPDGIFLLPKGANTGNVLHHIMERIDFSDTREHRSIISEVLAQHAYSLPHSDDVWLEQIERLLRKDMQISEHRLSLESIEPSSKLVEVEFTLPSEGPLLSRIQEALNAIDEQNEPDLAAWAKRFKQRTDAQLGYMTRGYIDLVCQRDGRYFLLDWKSNHLGNDASNYNQEELERAMGESEYHLQYLIYAVALTRFLKKRLPSFDYDSHFGGIAYVFFRGLDESDTQNGIYATKPNRKLIEALDAAFA